MCSVCGRLMSIVYVELHTVLDRVYVVLCLWDAGTGMTGTWELGSFGNGISFAYYSILQVPSSRSTTVDSTLVT